MTAPMTLDEWRNFGFRMSKKVAELSQVVHELFAKNHEREIENEELREIYEEEIARVIADANRRLEVIAEVSHKNEQKLKAEQAALVSSADAETSVAMEQAHLRLQGLLSQLEHEKAEREALRSRVARLQRDLDSSHRGVSEEISAREKELAAAKEECVSLRKRLATQERSIRDAEKTANHEKADLEAELSRYRKELRQVREDRTAANSKVRQLEEEIRTLRRELVRRSAAAAALRVGLTNGGKNVANGNGLKTIGDEGLEENNGGLTIPASEFDFTSGKQSRESIWSNGTGMKPSEIEHDLLLEEVENLRQQVQQYKMELSNRDSNFNKVFNSQNSRSLSPKRPLGTSQSRRSITKERAFSYIISQNPASTQEHPPYLRRSSLQPPPPPPQSPPRTNPLPSINDRNVSHQRVTMRYLNGTSTKSWS